MLMIYISNYTHDFGIYHINFHNSFPRIRLVKDNDDNDEHEKDNDIDEFDDGDKLRSSNSSQISNKSVGEFLPEFVSDEKPDANPLMMSKPVSL